MQEFKFKFEMSITRRLKRKSNLQMNCIQNVDEYCVCIEILTANIIMILRQT